MINQIVRDLKYVQSLYERIAIGYKPTFAERNVLNIYERRKEKSSRRKAKAA